MAAEVVTGAVGMRVVLVGRRAAEGRAKEGGVGRAEEAVVGMVGLAVGAVGAVHQAELLRNRSTSLAWLPRNRISKR